MHKLFNLVDGRKTLWQWDVNRFIYAFGCQQVHYSQLGEILAVAVENDMAAVPNEMLQNAADIRVLAYVTVDGNFTACDEHLSVIARPMPPDYVYTPTQVITFESLVEDVRNELLSLEARAQAGDFDGATFTPNVDTAGNISWSNNKDLPNPPSRDLLGPARAAQEAAEEAQEKAEDAQQAAESAQTGAENARGIAITAMNNAVDAKISAEIAKIEAETAQAAAEAAQTGANQAKADAQTAATTATAKAVDAAQSATNAGLSEIAAQAAQSEAEAAKTAAETAQRLAENARDATEGFKNTAGQSATVATEKATVATQKATEATASSTTATEKANISTQKAQEATAKAGEANQAKEDAEDAKDLAEGFARSAEQSATSASTSAISASTSATSAENAKTDAENARDRAEEAEEATQEARQEWENMSATASTLASDAPATAHYSDGVLTLGIPQGQKGDKGDTGEQGPQGAKGDTGEQGEQGPQGVQGLQGPAGADGADGADGITPTIGENGNWYLGDVDTGKPSRGVKGEKGEKGDDGATGPQGVQGQKGDKGDTGATGPQGVKGETGDTGNGIESTELNADYTLTLNFTDGTSYTTSSIRGAQGATGQQGIQGPKGNTGEQGPQGEQGERGIQGIQGPAGEAFSIYKTYASIAQMNADAANVPTGKFVIIASTVEDPDNAKLFVKAETSFSFVTDMSGAQGVKGDKGDQGIQGIQGPQGVQGVQGVAGEDGADGVTFTPSVDAAGNISWTNDGGRQNPPTQNIKGPKGDQGIQGIQGVKGDKGDTGNTGEQGIQGPKGDTGNTGATGPQGPKGDDGENGITPHINSSNKHWMIGTTDTGIVAEGQNGAKGDTGERGPQGVQGIQGVKGDKGDDGLTTSVTVNGETFTQSGGNINLGTLLRQHQSLSSYRTAAAQDSIDAGKVDDFTLDLYTGSAGNPRSVKFLTVNYAGTDSNNAVFVTLSAMSCHPNGSSYKFAEDITIGVTYTGGVGVDVQQSIRQSCGDIDGAEHFYGDVFYVVNTSTTTVDFYIYCGQWAHTKFTPYKRRNGAAGGTITQYNGTATYYSSGAKVYGNNDLIATKREIPIESTVSGWGFTKNTGTYSKPSTGIPKTDLATAVQTSLDKADSALQSHQSASTVNGANIGSATKGTYINASGKPTAMIYSLNKDVPSNAVFTDTDTKNTAGSTDTSSKIFLVGATSQAANPQTYSDNQVYATNGQLNGNSIRIAEAVNLVYDSTNKCLNFNFA